MKVLSRIFATWTLVLFCFGFGARGDWTHGFVYAHPIRIFQMFPTFILWTFDYEKD
jgi:hypothetical protein